MAVIKTITTERGVVFPDQYCRVDVVDVSNKNQMRFEVGVYLSQKSADLPPHRVELFNGDFDLYSDQNVWQQAYACLKTYWADAVDA